MIKQLLTAGMVAATAVLTPAPATQAYIDQNAISQQVMMVADLYNDCSRRLPSCYAYIAGVSDTLSVSHVVCYPPGIQTEMLGNMVYTSMMQTNTPIIGANGIPNGAATAVVTVLQTLYPCRYN